MVVRRSRLVRAPVEAVWPLVADAHHLPRWWPRTIRVEDVAPGGWTSVLATDRGRSVRADFRVLASEPGRVRRWAQELDGTPFAALLREAVTEVRLGPEGAGSRVTVELSQHPRGWARLGGLMLRRAARRQLDEALGALAGLVEG